MSSVNFDQLLDEAYISGLGFEAAEQNQVQRVAKEAAFTEELLDGHTSPNAELPEYRPNVELLRHPAEAQFEMDDIENIARVRAFGRALIDHAKEALRAHKEVDLSTSESIIRSSYRAFQSHAWYKEHPEVEDRDQGAAPDTASPNRIATWPQGEYMNCLGISIVMAAASELAELDYLFVNELRTSDDMLAEQHESFIARFNQMAPGFFERPEVRAFFDLLDKSTGREQKGGDMLFETPEVLRADRIKPRDFHHSVAAKYFSDGNWVEIDPYNLTFRGYNAGGVLFDSLHTWAGRPENSASLAIIDDSPTINGLFRHFDQALKRLRRFNERAPLVFSDEAANYKQRRFLDAVYGGMLAVAENVYNDLLGPGDEEEDELLSPKNLALIHGSLTFDKLLVLFAEEYAPGTRAQYEMRIKALRAKREGKDRKEYERLVSFGEELREAIWQRIQQNKPERERLARYLHAVPYIIIADTYRATMLNAFSIREHSTPDVAAEYCAPEFAIGAAYLNHYATWRNDGRVNIANYLVEISPSQLLWHASLQDGEAPSPRAEAVGRQIAQLKPTQLHPHVYIARALNP